MFNDIDVFLLSTFLVLHNIYSFPRLIIKKHSNWTDVVAQWVKSPCVLLTLRVGIPRPWLPSAQACPLGPFSELAFLPL